MDYSQHTDESLLYLIGQHNADALVALYDRHASTVYGLIIRIIRDKAEADELLQDTFWQVWRKVLTYEGNGSGAAWLFRIARNLSLDRLRKLKAQSNWANHTIPTDHEVFAQIPDHRVNVEHAAIVGWKRQQLREALARLPQDQLQVLELAYFAGLTQHQIAEETKTPVGTVKSRVRMALEKLERALRATGFRAEDVEL